MSGSQIGMLLIWFGLLPEILGMLYTRFLDRDRDSLILNYCAGLIIMLAVCQIVTVPQIFSGGSLTTVYEQCMQVLIVLCILSVVLNITYYAKLIRGAYHTLRHSTWTAWLAVILIVIQACTLSTQTHYDEDDAFYVATAATAVAEDELYTVDPYTGEEYEEMPARYVLSPFPIFLAVTYMLTGVLPAAVAHTVLPLVMIPFAYMIFALLGRQLFGKNRWASGCFLLLAAILYMFSGYSVYTEGTFLLIRVWQGKAILAAALIPAIYYFTLRMAEKKRRWANAVMMLMLMFACCHVSSMGIILGAIAAGISALACSVRYRAWPVIPWTIAACIPNIIYAVTYNSIR